MESRTPITLKEGRINIAIQQETMLLLIRK